MYLKIDLSSDLFGELSSRVNSLGSLVRETENRNIKSSGRMPFAYDVFCQTSEITFSVMLSFLSHGSVFAYCSCGLPEGQRCGHIEEALVFHQECSRYELERLFGADVIVEESVF